MSEIIGRTAEQKELEVAYSSNDAEFIAVYGRRRIGKTYLIKNYFESKKCIYFQMTGKYKGTLNDQLIRFAKEIGEAFYSGASIKVEANWMDAFEELRQAINRVAKNKKIIIFLDELPWMATRKSGVISAIEYFWNRYWSNDKRIKLIVCGSAASFIIKKIIKNRGGLHNRVTRKIRLLPFNLYETSLYLNQKSYKCTKQQIAKIYMVFGGVPYYLNQLQKNLSVDQNIDKLLFKSESVLFDEFEEIFASLFDNSEQYTELITLIAANKDGIQRSVLDERNKLTGKGGRLTHRLEDLENAGFISSYIPYGHQKLGIYYRINDEYCYFYLKWIKPEKVRLKNNNITHYWRRILNTAEYYSWLGYSFENLCYKHILQIRKSLDIDDTSFASPWRYVPRKYSEGQGAQIDLLFDQKDSVTVCEIKYSDSIFVIDKKYFENIKQKLQTFRVVTRTSKQLFFVLIAANGVKQNDYFEDIVNGVVNLDDLYK